MIDDLDKILKSILRDEDAPEIVKGADIDFAIPKAEYENGLKDKTVNLYLYDVHENRVLRDPVPIVERVGDTYVRRRPPLRVDCSYMVTAWSIEEGEALPAEEHLLLSQALLWLSQFSTIPIKHLPTEWTNKDKDNAKYQPFPVPMWVAQMDGVKEPGEFWAALETPPRPFFNLVVTIAMDLRKTTDEGPPVTTKITTYGQKEEDREAIIKSTEIEEGLPIVMGEIKKLDLDKKSFVLVKSDKEFEVLVNDTKIKKNGKEAELGDLNEGDEALVMGTWKDEDTIEARLIEVPIPEAAEELIQIGGRVVDTENPAQGIKGAKVILVELSKTETTDEEGRFSFPGREKSKTFPGLTAGEYTLKVFAQGFNVKEQKIDVPGPPEEYEIGLSRAGP